MTLNNNNPKIIVELNIYRVGIKLSVKFITCVYDDVGRRSMYTFVFFYISAENDQIRPNDFSNKNFSNCC